MSNNKNVEHHTVKNNEKPTLSDQPRELGKIMLSKGTKIQQAKCSFSHVDPSFESLVFAFFSLGAPREDEKLEKDHW